VLTLPPGWKGEAASRPYRGIRQDGHRHIRPILKREYVQRACVALASSSGAIMGVVGMVAARLPLPAVLGCSGQREIPTVVDPRPHLPLSAHRHRPHAHAGLAVATAWRSPDSLFYAFPLPRASRV